MTGVLWSTLSDPAELARKGELIPNYYNPHGMFSRVGFMALGRPSTNYNRSFVEACGGVCPEVYYVSRLLPGLARRAALDFQPDLIRSGDRLTASLGAIASKATGAPLVVSLHGHRPHEWGHPSVSMLRRAYLRWDDRHTRDGIARAYKTVIVYEALRDYALRHAHPLQIVKIPNVVCPWPVVPKTRYAIVRKRPLVAILGSADALRWSDWVAKAADMAGCDVVHYRGIPNRDMCSHLATVDIACAHSLYPGVSKGMMEAMWLGVPLMVNEEVVASAPELKGAVFATNDFTTSLRTMCQDTKLRTAFGKHAIERAMKLWNPRRAEQQWADLYLEAMRRA